MKALVGAVFPASATAFSSSDKSGRAEPTATGATSAVDLSSATKDAAKQYLEKFIADNNIPDVLIQATTPGGSCVLLRGISKILFPNNHVNVPVIK